MDTVDVKLEIPGQPILSIDEPSPEEKYNIPACKLTECDQLAADLTKCCHTSLSKVADVISEETQTEKDSSDVGTSTTCLVQCSTKSDVTTQTISCLAAVEPNYDKQDTVIQSSPYSVTALSEFTLHEGTDKTRLRRSSRIAAKKAKKASENEVLRKPSEDSTQTSHPCKSKSLDSKEINSNTKVPAEESNEFSENVESKETESADRAVEKEKNTPPVNSWTCAKQNCLTCSSLTSGSCSTQGTIYLITCLVDNCQATYIGETHRKLNERFTEHWRTCANPHFESYKMRAMGMHYASAHSGFKPKLQLEILEKMKGQKKRRERESQLILERKPSLNIYRPNLSLS